MFELGHVVGRARESLKAYGVDEPVAGSVPPAEWSSEEISQAFAEDVGVGE